jgi:hypothetical protein
LEHGLTLEMNTKGRLNIVLSFNWIMNGWDVEKNNIADQGQGRNDRMILRQKKKNLKDKIIS